MDHLGIDIAKKSFHCTLLLAGKRYHRTCQNNPDGFAELSVWLAKHPVEPVHACMEATGVYWEDLAEYLIGRGHKVSVVNPKRIHDYARSKLMRNKTDKLDADLIAQFCASQNPALWVPLPEAVRQLLDLVRHLEDLKNMRIQEANRLSDGKPSAAVRQLLEAHLAFMDQQIKALTEQIQAHIAQSPDLKAKRDLLVTISGIAELTAARLLAENIQAFRSTRQLVAFYGLNPQKAESGTSVHRKERLSKIGRGSLRKALYFPAMSAIRHNPIVKAFCEQLTARGKIKMVVIGAAMRKLLCLALGVLKSGIPFDPNYVRKVHIGA